MRFIPGWGAPQNTAVKTACDRFTSQQDLQEIEMSKVYQHDIKLVIQSITTICNYTIITTYGELYF